MASTHQSLAHLARTLEMRPRKPQIMMANAIDNAFALEQPIVVPADTGVGKSLVYASAIHAHLEQDDTNRVLVATSTKILQTQLIRDLPNWLSEYSVMDIRGKKNYLCSVKQSGAPIAYHDVDVETRDEFSGEDWEWETYLSVSADECLGSKCQVRRNCPSVLAMENIQEAHVVVTNHAMFALNMRLGFLEQVRPFTMVVVDEAHDFESALQDSYEASLTAGRLSWLHGRLKAPAETDISFLKRAAEAFMPFVNRTVNQSKEKAIRLVPGTQEHVNVDHFLNHLLTELRRVHLDPLSNRVDSGTKLLAKIKSDVKLLMSESTNICRSVETDPKPKIAGRPIDVSTMVPDYLKDGKKAIFTSATIQSDLPTRLGIDGSKGVKANIRHDIPPYFDYQQQGLLYVVPKSRLDLAYKYGTPNHGMIGGNPTPRSLFLKNIIDRVPGGCLLLFASAYDMRQAHKALSNKLGRRCLLQGNKSMSATIEEFRNDESSVFFATRSFEQGVDFPGRTLQCVVFDRIPNPPPNDIWTAALTAHYGNYGVAHKPTVYNRMKQAAGRAIRSSDDKALIVVMDSRFAGLTNVLQPFRFTTSVAEVVEWLGGIDQWNLKKDSPASLPQPNNPRRIK